MQLSGAQGIQEGKSGSVWKSEVPQLGSVQTFGQKCRVWTSSARDSGLTDQGKGEMSSASLSIRTVHIS